MGDRSRESLAWRVTGKRLEVRDRRSDDGVESERWEPSGARQREAEPRATWEGWSRSEWTVGSWQLEKIRDEETAEAKREGISHGETKR
jgi:hypothetical protein